MTRGSSSDLIAALPEALRRRVRSTPQPDWIPPMLATPTARRFSAEGWLFERKLDGERCLSYCCGDSVSLWSRNRRRLDGTYPEIVDALRRRRHDVVIDGEVVAFDDDGTTSFARLQRRLGITDPDAARRTGIAVSYYVFDLLHVDGRDVTQLPLYERKSLLRAAVRFHDPVVYTEHRERDGEAFFEEACRRRWEGLIAKSADGTYVSRRSPDWLKFRCSNEQELVVIGFTEPRRTRVALGALLLGYHEGDRLVYAGKVGTGFDVATLLSLRARLGGLERSTSPLADAQRVRERGVHWVRPELVAQIAFTEWTTDGLLRHPRYLGLRDDKAARDVVRERAAEVGPA